MVPPAGLEPALPKETDFESVASTNSAKGARGTGMSELARGDGRTQAASWWRTPHRALYEWTMGLAASRGATPAMATVSFAESSFFPIPPDVLLIPIAVARPERWLRWATVCTLASVAGAFVGYAIGALLFEAVAQPILAFYDAEAGFERLREWYAEYGGWAVFAAALTPFPYKVITIFSGAVGMNLVAFALVSLIGRAARFFLVAWLCARFGPPVRLFIERYLGLLTILFVVLLAGGFYALRFIGH